MAVHEEARFDLHRRLEEVLGRPAATTLMEHLPPVGWGDVARRSDIEALQAATKRDIEALQAATKRDIEALQAATKRDIEALQAATKRDIDVLSASFDAKLHSALNDQTRTLVVTMVYANLGAIFTAAGLAFAAARFH